jgi:hypothetical protein
MTRRRTLREMEREIAASDPGLYAFYLSFTRRTEGDEMPRAEKAKAWPARMLARLRPRRAHDRIIRHAGPPRWR